MPSEDAKAVRKGDDRDEGDEKSLSSILESRKKKPTNANATIKAKPKVKKEELKDEYEDFEKPGKRVTAGAKDSRVKKEQNDIDDDDHKPISKKKSTTATTPAKADNKEPKKKKKKGEEKKAEVAQNGKREKKVYDLPGQKRDPPEERDPLRIFYETLYKQVPKSEMAQFWMMEYGLLSFDEAKKAFEKKQKKSQQQKFSSPTKAISSVTQTALSVTVKKKPPPSPVSSSKKNTADPKVAIKQPKKRRMEDESSEDDSDDDFTLKKVAKKQKAK